MAVANHYGATTAWFVEFDKHPSAILAHHYPDVPNYGDVTTIDWSQVEPVDIITGGFPCQDVSHAGLRRGVHHGTRSGLWFEMAKAIDQLKPWKVVIENVAGLLSADAAGDVEPCPWCVGDEPAGHMRALGAVLADLAEAGFDAEWCSVRASDAGAPHRRERVFIVATHTDHRRRGERLRAYGRVPAVVGDSGGAWPEDTGLTLLPTPAVNDMGRTMTVEAWDEWTGRLQGKGYNGNGHGRSLHIEAQRLLPTPKASDGPNGVPDRDLDGGFGQYTAAIARWEQVIGRPAPSPTEPGEQGRARLSVRFVEWMMGLPDGWVTGVGVPRSRALACLGNGVVPQQALLALELLDGPQ